MEGLRKSSKVFFPSPFFHNAEENMGNKPNHLFNTAAYYELTLREWFRFASMKRRALEKHNSHWSRDKLICSNEALCVLLAFRFSTCHLPMSDAASTCLSQNLCGEGTPKKVERCFEEVSCKGLQNKAKVASTACSLPPGWQLSNHPPTWVKGELLATASLLGTN